MSYAGTDISNGLFLKYYIIAEPTMLIWCGAATGFVTALNYLHLIICSVCCYHTVVAASRCGVGVNVHNRNPTHSLVISYQCCCYVLDAATTVPQIKVSLKLKDVS